jgi:hypothetical protein
MLQLLKSPYPVRSYDAFVGIQLVVSERTSKSSAGLGASAQYSTIPREYSMCKTLRARVKLRFAGQESVVDVNVARN